MPFRTSRTVGRPFIPSVTRLQPPSDYSAQTGLSYVSTTFVQLNKLEKRGENDIAQVIPAQVFTRQQLGSSRFSQWRLRRSALLATTPHVSRTVTTPPPPHPAITPHATIRALLFHEPCSPTPPPPHKLLRTLYLQNYVT